MKRRTLIKILIPIYVIGGAVGWFFASISTMFEVSGSSNWLQFYQYFYPLTLLVLLYMGIRKLIIKAIKK